MADKRDYYEVLGLKKGASDEEIKNAYRRLVKEYHPDLHPGDKSFEAKTMELNEAYGVLSDPEKRAKYDQFGHAAFDPNAGFGGGDGYGGGFGGMDDLGDILGSIFGGGFGGFGGGFGGGGRTRNGPQRGESVRARTTIEFTEAAFGCKKDVAVTRIENCDECGGSGCAKGTTADTCPDCHGSGVVQTQQRTPFGVMASTTACRRCGGTGKLIKSPCSRCNGKGKIRRQRTVNVSIPAGIDDGQTIALKGQGHVGGNGGPAGDLLLTVSVRPHPQLQRDGTSVLFEMPISFVQAALGAEVEVPTLDGKVKYKIPEGTQTGTTFRLRGKGIPALNSSGSRGDQFVTVNVVTPKNLNKEQKELLQEFEESLEGGGGSLFSRAKRKRK